MKKSLACPRTFKSAQNRFGLSPNKLQVTATQLQNQQLNQRNPLQQNNENPNIRQRHNNNNQRMMPTSMSPIFSYLLTMDISYNKLSNQQIQKVMSSCTQLVTLCIQGNYSSIIPSSISKLKDLRNFRHDWLAIESKNIYEPEERLQLIKNSAIRPQLVTKVNKLVGMDFQIYCRRILKVQMDKVLLIKIQQCDSSPFAKKNMLKYMTNLNGQKKKNFQIMATQKQQDLIAPGCFDIYKLSAKELTKRKAEKIIKDKGEKEYSEMHKKCKNYYIYYLVQSIRDIPELQYNSIALEMSSQNIEPYSFPDKILHQKLSNFDQNKGAAAEIDALLLDGFNPNQYDQNGFSPYHICVIYNQIKGLQYIIQISLCNPGFFDLEMPSVKDFRNILHLCVFLQNYKLTKMLIQFGFPYYKRDFGGERIQHLVDSNLEFLYFIRKLLKRKTRNVLSHAPLACFHSKRMYVRNSDRCKQESKMIISQSTNNNVLENYELAVGFHK